MVIRHQNPVFDPLASDARALKAPGGFGAAAGEAFDTSPGPLAFRAFRRHVVTPAMERAGLAEAPETLDAKTATERYGVEGELSFGAPVREDRAAELNAIKRREILRRSIMERSGDNAPTRLAWSFAGALADPLNAAIAFVPAAWLARAGFAARGGASSRLATRAGLGVAEGAAGGVIAEAIALPLARAEERDYDFGDSLAAVFWSAALGGVLTPAFGAVGDAVLGPPVGARADMRRAHAEAMAEAIDAVSTGRAAEVQRPIEVARAEAAARVERAAGEPIPMRHVRDDVAISPSGRQAAVRYAIVELDDLIVSHTDEFAVNPRFPEALQPRDRTRAGSAAQVAEIAANFNPRLLDDSPDINGGAPMIAPDGVVESGNGRSLVLRRLYSQGGEKAKAYREYLASRGYPVEGVEKPVLVRIRDEEMTGRERLAFIQETAAAREAQLSAAEQGRLDAARVDPNVFELLGDDHVGALSNVNFTREFARAVANANELGRLIDASGRLSREGRARFEAAVTAYAYDEARLVSMLLEGDDVLKGVGRAMVDASPQWARMRAANRAGAMDPAADITPNLIAAAELVRRARRDDTTVAALLGQSDMFGSAQPATIAMLRIFFRDDAMTQPRAAAKISKELQFYADEARKTQAGPGLFGDEPGFGGDPAGRILAAARGRGDGETALRNFEPVDDPARLIDAPEGGGRVSGDAGEGVGQAAARAGSSDGTPTLSRNEAVAGGAAMKSAQSTPAAVTQVSPLHSRSSAPPSAFGDILTAPPSSFLGHKAQSGRVVMHASDDLGEVYASLSAKKAFIDKDIASLVNDVEGATFGASRLKERGARLDQKIAARPVSEIGDLLGARIVVENPAALSAVLDGLQARGAHILDIDDFLDAPKGPGYRAVHVQIAAGEVSFELQVQPAPIRAVQGEAHKIYERWRGREVAADDMAAFVADQARAKQLFDDAWESWRARAVDRSAPASAQDAPPAAFSPEQRAILDQIEADSAAVTRELDDALTEGRITKAEYEAAIAGAEPGDIAGAYDAAAFCLARSV